eukprot:136645-Prymnesium_polylepis.2
MRDPARTLSVTPCKTHGANARSSLRQRSWVSARNARPCARVDEERLQGRAVRRTETAHRWPQELSKLEPPEAGAGYDEPEEVKRHTHQLWRPLATLRPSTGGA